MTDRLKGVVVTFDRDIREDDAESIINALRMVKGVLSVNPVKSDFNDAMLCLRVRSELRSKLYKVLEDEW